MARTPPLLLALALGLSACIAEPELAPEPELEPLATGESRSIELLHLRFEAADYPLRISLEQLQQMPEQTLRETWLLDLDARPLITNALNILLNTPFEELAAFEQAEYNMWKLLNLSPDTTQLDGTRLEPLIEVGEFVDIPSSLILADLLEVGKSDRVIGVDLLTEGVVENVMGTHPNAQQRLGSGGELYPVTPGAIPVSLYDVVNGFADLPEVFGPIEAGAAYPDSPAHPGFIADTTGLVATTPEFAMTVKANLNALPYTGVDATNVSEGRVNSLSSQIDQAFDFSDPDWMEIEGLVEQLSIPELSMVIRESDQFWPGGDSMEPLGQGNSPVWDEVPPYEFEALLMSIARKRAALVEPHCTAYSPPQNAEDPFVAVNACFSEEAWVTIDIETIELPEVEVPPPSYFWDILVEVAQVRLHDGGLAEGEGDVRLNLRDIPVGITADMLVEQIKANITADPASLTRFAELVNNNAEGDPDFFYYQASNPAGGPSERDYLYFVTEDDIRLDESGAPVRAYAYQHPGFFADPELSQKLSSLEPLDGDTSHEKLEIAAGDELYFEDDVQRRYRIRVGEKPSTHRITLELERIQ